MDVMRPGDIAKVSAYSGADGYRRGRLFYKAHLICLGPVGLQRPVEILAPVGLLGPMNLKRPVPH